MNTHNCDRARDTLRALIRIRNPWSPPFRAIVRNLIHADIRQLRSGQANP